MKGKELYRLLQEHFPNEAALSWDNVGLLCGRMDKDIRKIYVALDATTEVIDDAVGVGADLLLTHHPVIFSAIKRIEENDYLGERLLRMIENHMSCYAMHTNYDVRRMADLVVSKMGLKNLQVLEPTDTDGSEGIGYTGDLEASMTLKECAVKLKEWFRIPDVRVYGDLKQEIHRVRGRQREWKPLLWHRAGRCSLAATSVTMRDWIVLKRVLRLLTRDIMVSSMCLSMTWRSF